MTNRLIATALVALSSLVFISCGAPAATNAPSNKASNTAGNAAPKAADTAAAETEVKKMMDDFSAALNKNDADAIGKFYTDDYSLIDGNGQVQTKASRTEQIRSGKVKLEGVKFGDMKVSMHPTGDAAVVTGKASGKSTTDGKTEDVSSMVTWIVVKGADGWKFSRAQITNIKAGS
ncbi:MAG: nuclear transport factor 2 family protein [Acidobacteria bacterium]|nr:nuclear transport factor 2 family protein [Acidobacteriota bacterium]